MAYLEVTAKKNLFRNNTFLFFKIENWNFQQLSEIEFRESSHNFNSFRSFRKLLFSFFLPVVWLSSNFVRFHDFPFQTDAESSAFFLEKQKKVLFSKKIFLGLLSILKQKSFVYWLNFSGRFWLVLLPTLAIVPGLQTQLLALSLRPMHKGKPIKKEICTFWTSQLTSNF